MLNFRWRSQSSSPPYGAPLVYLPTRHSHCIWNPFVTEVGTLDRASSAPDPAYFSGFQLCLVYYLLICLTFFWTQMCFLENICNGWDNIPLWLVWLVWWFILYHFSNLFYELVFSGFLLLRWSSYTKQKSLVFLCLYFCCCKSARNIYCFIIPSLNIISEFMSSV